MAFFDCGGVRLMLSLPEHERRRRRAERSRRSSTTPSTTSSRRRRRSEGRGVVLRSSRRTCVARLPHADLWMAFLRDPDGHLLAIMSEVGEQRQAPRSRRPGPCGRNCRLRLPIDAAEAGLLIEAARGVEIALRPQRDLLVAGVAREADAFVDQPAADAEPARRRFDQQQPQLGDASSTCGPGTPSRRSRRARSAIQQRSPDGSKWSRKSAQIRATSASNRWS